MNVEAGKMDMETRAELQAKNFLAKYCKRITLRRSTDSTLGQI